MNTNSILIVDSDIMIHRVIKEIAKNWQCTVFNAYNGNEAFNIMCRISPTLIIIEQFLPDMYGTDFLRILRSKNFNLNILVLSNYLTADLIMLLKPFNILQALPKPIDNVALQQWIIYSFNNLPSHNSLENISNTSKKKKDYSIRPPVSLVKEKPVEDTRKSSKLALRKRIKEKKEREKKEAVKKIELAETKTNSDFDIKKLKQLTVDPFEYDPSKMPDSGDSEDLKSGVSPMFTNNSHPQADNINQQVDNVNPGVSRGNINPEKKDFKKISTRIEKVLGEIETGMELLDSDCEPLDTNIILDLQESFKEFMSVDLVNFENPDIMDDFFRSSSMIEKIDASFQFRVSEDSMSLFMTIFPPSGGGKICDKEEILQNLYKIGIKHGIDHLEIQKSIKRICNGQVEPYKTVIVKGTLQINGTDDRMIMHKKFIPAQKKNSDKKIDFKNISNVCMVKPGDLLIEILPGLPGKKGINIYGNEVSFHAGKKVILNPGDNISLSDDGLKYFSSIEGNMKLSGNTVKVVDYYFVDGDVDYSVGNISYKGNIYIKGNVLDNFTIKAAGDVVITGNVNASYIYAAGDIIVFGGIVARDKGLILANGSVQIKFAEHAEIEAGGNIIVNNSSVFSKLYSNARITVQSGRLIGGSCFAREFVNVIGNLGSDQAKTHIHVGSDFLKERQAEKMKLEIKNWESKMLSLKQLMVSIKSKSFSIQNLSEEDKLQVFEIFKAHKKIENVVLSLREKIELIKLVDINKSFNHDSFIQAKGQISQDILVYFGSVRFFLRSEYQNTRLKYDELKGEIKTFSYQKMNDDSLEKIEIPHQ